MAMRICAEAKRKLEVCLLAAIAYAAVRTRYILYQRHGESSEQKNKQAAPPLNPDYYVTPKKLYPYDLKSARQLTRQPVWTRDGYRYTFYPYDPSRRRTDFAHEAGQLLPIQKLQIKTVVTDLSPGSTDQRQIMAVFQEDRKDYAFPIGSVRAGNYQIYSDNMLYIQDPHELYKHWPADVWQAIEKHEVKPGMNELQADFAIGMGIAQQQSNPAVKTVNYPSGGNELTITYRNGKAAEISPGPKQ